MQYMLKLNAVKQYSSDKESNLVLRWLRRGVNKLVKARDIESS